MSQEYINSYPKEPLKTDIDTKSGITNETPRQGILINRKYLVSDAAGLIDIQNMMAEVREFEREQEEALRKGDREMPKWFIDSLRSPIQKPPVKQ
jgi:hypothetical protein